MESIRNIIRNVPDFPKPGILFKDITPLLQDPKTGAAIISEFRKRLEGVRVDAILGVESRGFLFGYALALQMGVPFVPVRKSGKLPWKTIGTEYELEYGKAKIEMHEDALKPGSKVIIHDDLLATGGTAAAAARLVQMAECEVSAFAFVVELGFLEGRKNLADHSGTVISLVEY
ncbi:MAG TPA: adenine phosphoribosyltransferase [Bacteroidia bacterium]|nr:adenine phosphoribosyltransferase [Bacteroidia bacterium]